MAELFCWLNKRKIRERERGIKALFRCFGIDNFVEIFFFVFCCGALCSDFMQTICYLWAKLFVLLFGLFADFLGKLHFSQRNMCSKRTKEICKWYYPVPPEKPVRWENCTTHHRLKMQIENSKQRLVGRCGVCDVWMQFKLIYASKATIFGIKFEYKFTELIPSFADTAIATPSTIEFPKNCHVFSWSAAVKIHFTINYQAANEFPRLTASVFNLISVVAHH